ncbi:MAG: hypothetical protein QME69_09405, partial [Candidatus Saccharicenans sp.]|nr:hypothetical protein [Candidatus Saccharicenans sp.]
MNFSFCDSLAVSFLAEIRETPSAAGGSETPRATLLPLLPPVREIERLPRLVGAGADQKAAKT